MSYRPGSALIKRITTLACLVVFAGALSACDSKSSNPNSPSGHQTLIASGHPEWPPIMYQNGSAIDGAGPALVKKIFDDLGVTVSSSPIPARGTKCRPRPGPARSTCWWPRTRRPSAKGTWSTPTRTPPTRCAIFVARGKAFPFDSWDVLVGKRGIAMVGDSYGQAFDDFAAARLQLTARDDERPGIRSGLERAGRLPPLLPVRGRRLSEENGRGLAVREPAEVRQRGELLHHDLQEVSIRVAICRCSTRRSRSTRPTAPSPRSSPSTRTSNAAAARRHGMMTSARPFFATSLSTAAAIWSRR